MSKKSRETGWLVLPFRIWSIRFLLLQMVLLQAGGLWLCMDLPIRFHRFQVQRQLHRKENGEKSLTPLRTNRISLLEDSLRYPRRHRAEAAGDLGQSSNGEWTFRGHVLVLIGIPKDWGNHHTEAGFETRGEREIQLGGKLYDIWRSGESGDTTWYLAWPDERETRMEQMRQAMLDSTVNSGHDPATGRQEAAQRLLRKLPGPALLLPAQGISVPVQLVVTAISERRIYGRDLDSPPVPPPRRTG